MRRRDCRLCQGRGELRFAVPPDKSFLEATLEDCFNEVSVPCPVCQKIVPLKQVEASCFYAAEHGWKKETEEGRLDIMAEMKGALEKRIAHELVAKSIAEFKVTGEDEQGRVHMRAVVGFVAPGDAEERADQQRHERFELLDNLRKSIHATIDWRTVEAVSQWEGYSRHDAHAAVNQCFDRAIKNLMEI